jgi:hypothetical protein
MSEAADRPAVLREVPPRSAPPWHQTTSIVEGGLGAML